MAGTWGSEVRLTRSPNSGRRRAPQGRIAGGMTAFRKPAAAVLLLFLSALGAAQAQERAKQHQIAMIRPAGSLSLMSDTGLRNWRAFFEELRRLGDVEGQNLTVERYSGEGHPEGYPDLAREVVNRNPDAIVAITTPIAEAARMANDAIPIVWIGVETIGVGLVTSLARPGRNITGVNLYDYEIWGKRLQILKEAVPS